MTRYCPSGSSGSCEPEGGSTLPWILRICGAAESRRRIFLQILHDDFHGLFELRVMSRSDQRWILLDLHVRCDADVLNLPLAGSRVVDARRWRGHRTAVHECW